MVISLLLSLGAGIFCIWAAYTRKGWFFRSARAALFVKLFGEEGARIFYMILGGFLIVASLILMAH